MSLHTAQTLVALAASVVMLLQVPAKLFPAIATLAAALEALLAFQLISFSVRGINLGFVLGVTLIVCAVIVWARNGQKAAVTASTAVALIGAMQVFTTLA
jgi:hypothetical protein